MQITLAKGEKLKNFFDTLLNIFKPVEPYTPKKGDVLWNGEASDRLDHIIDNIRTELEMLAENSTPIINDYKTVEIGNVEKAFILFKRRIRRGRY